MSEVPLYYPSTGQGVIFDPLQVLRAYVCKVMRHPKKIHLSLLCTSTYG